MSDRFDLFDTHITGLKVIQRKPVGDGRGYLERMFCIVELQALIPGRQIVQINHSLTASRGTVRGMHFQMPPHAETKFVSCLRGEVFDVAVDIRSDSPTFLQWHAEVLSASNHKTMVVPEGFAHGFQALTDDSEILYFSTELYWPSAESGLHADDPKLGIRWLLPVSGLSPRDATRPFLNANFKGVT